jgi:transposase InsO family protein
MRAALLRLRQSHPTWGAKKLRWRLRKIWPRRRLPHVRTLERWLPLEAGPRRRKLLWCAPSPRRVVRRCHDVWTVDFKGWFRTADGRRCEPLTVREACSCFLLHCAHVAPQSDPAVRPVFKRLFRAYGPPRAIRVDNGPPFGGTGALGLSTLSTWWLRLGIAVEFGRPAHPEDNAAHEQMHRVLKAEAATHPEANLAAQNRRLESWRRKYNHARPHEGLGQQPPAHRFRTNRRRFPTTLPEWIYPKTYAVRQVSRGGWISWQGRRRLIGRAFAGERIALHAQPDHHAVYLGPHLLGQLHARDRGGLRPIRLRQ